MNADGPLTGIAALIPEVYFDVISRIPPGMFVLLIIMLNYFNPSMKYLAIIKDINWAIGGVFAVILFGSAYVVGLLITPIGTLVSLPHCHILHKSTMKKHRDLIVQFCAKKKIKGPNDEDFVFYEFYSALKEFLRDNDPEGRPVLAKMHAEYALCHNMMAAIILSILGLILKDRGFGLLGEQWITNLLLPLLILSVYAAMHRYKRALARHLICLQRFLP